MPEMANPHTPEELAWLSTLVHNLAGWLLILLSAAMLVETMRGVPKGRLRYAWPGLGMVIGLGLTVYVFLHMRLHHEVSPFAVPAQVQHQLIGLCLGLGATAEFLRRRWRSEHRLWKAAWPLGIIGVGVAFLVHEQGTFRALAVHWALAGTLLLGGLALLAVVLSGEEAKTMRILAVLVLAGAAAQLVMFREEPGAHGGHGMPPMPGMEHKEH